jgi:phospholipase/lecithinase/hemolysin
MEFLASPEPRRATPHTLYVLWAGANDLLGGAQAPSSSQMVSNIVHAARLLWRDGARHIMVLNVPDLGLTPLGRASGLSDFISQSCADYNQALEDALDDLEHAGISTVRVDAFAVLRVMVNFPALFDFANVTEPFLFAGGNPDEFLFWDPVHPTTRGHRILADDALDELMRNHCSRQECEVRDP